MIELSVIIPIYNTPVEDLQRCFNSVLGLENHSVEVLLMDDGSKEETASFCSSYCKKHRGLFKYYPLEHAGVSKARNEGIKKSLGRLLCFLDSDDTVEPAVILEAIEIKNADIVIFNKNIIENGRTIAFNFFENRKSSFVSYKEVFERILKNTVFSGCTEKIIKKFFLEKNGISFTDNMVINEDLLFVLGCLEGEPTIYFLNKTGYFYYRKETSSLGRLREYPLQSIKDFHNVNNFSRKLAIEFHLPDQDQIVDFLIRQEVHKIFQWVCEQINAKQFTDDKKKIAVQYAQLNDDSYGKGISAIKVMYYLIKNERWHIISVLAFLRRIYLSLNMHLIHFGNTFDKK